MMKNLLFAVAVLNLALAGGCAKGGNGIVTPPITIDVAITSPVNLNPMAVYATQSLTLTATTSSGPNMPVTWTLTGGGTITPVTPATNPPTAIYVAPASATSGVTVTATEVADSSIQGSLAIDVVPVSVVVTPLTVSVGENLVQQFTAVAEPGDAPQSFTWTCTPSSACGGFSGPSGSDVAVYTAPSSAASGVQVTATSTVPQSSPGSGASKVSVVTSRLVPGTYAFQFSGYDNNGASTAAAGSLTVSTTGITGIEDVLNASGPSEYTITSGTYAPITGNNFSNGIGTLTLNLTNGTTNITNTYTAVVTSVVTSSSTTPPGAIRVIESDIFGSGSGVLQMPTSGNSFNSAGQTFAFGFTGVDSNAQRVGYAGLLPMTPNSNGTGGTIAGGMLDSNDNGTLTTVCSSPPCSVTGTYTQNANGVWQMTLTAGTATLYFDFYVSAGTAQTKTGPDPLTLFAISTANPNDPTQPISPALSGSMVYQVSPMTSGYNNAAFSGASVSNLTGANANVSLTFGTTDGTSSGTGGAGNFSGVFDQNNNGTILSAVTFPSASQTTNPYTYVASGTAGRYTFNMLGNPNASPVVPPVPFVLYASGANRGFLLDQSTSMPATVMTGTMTPQPALKSFVYSGSELPGVFAGATISNSDPSLAPVVQNLLLTSTGLDAMGTPTYVLAGTQNPGNQSLTGAYTLTGTTAPGTGTITLSTPASQTYVIYAIDASTVSGTTNDVVTDFMMIGSCTPQAPATTCSGTPSTIIFAQQ